MPSPQPPIPEDLPEVGPLRRPPRDTDDEMDITPMIDITFLLLIFFIVSSVPDKTTAIELAEAQEGVAVSQLTSTVFTVGDGGLDLAPVYEADGKIPGTELSNVLEERNEQIRIAVEAGFSENKTDVVIKADKSVAYRNVDRVIKAASKVQGIKIHLAVLETR